tara:strand:+ start:1023 stop:1172 length:150 start_codon:yes stop_codon:yes gene_type:complete
MKATKHRPDHFLMERKYFFEHLSYFLPPGELHENNEFKQWLRNTKDLPN